MKIYCIDFSFQTVTVNANLFVDFSFWLILQFLRIPIGVGGAVENMLYIWLRGIRRTLKIRGREAPSMKALVEMSVDSYFFTKSKKSQIKVVNNNVYSNIQKAKRFTESGFPVQKDCKQIFVNPRLIISMQ